MEEIKIINEYEDVECPTCRCCGAAINTTMVLDENVENELVCQECNRII